MSCVLFPTIVLTYPYNSINVVCPSAGTIDCPSGQQFEIDGNDCAVQALFNENYFRSNINSNDLEALNHGILVHKYIDAYDYWIKVGIRAGWSPNQFYDENTYLKDNPDVRAMVKGSAINPNTNIIFLDSGLQHWLLWGATQIIALSRTSSAPVPSALTFTATVGDNLVADPFIGNLFIGSDVTIQTGDFADGINAALSSLTLLLNGDTGIAVIRNIGTINATVLNNGATFYATKVSSLTTINSINSLGQLNVANLITNPALAVTNSSGGFDITYVDSVFVTNNQTASISVEGMVGGAIILNNTNSGYFSTIAITSRGSTVNAINKLGGTGLIGSATLGITSSGEISISLDSAVSTIRTVTAAPKAAVIFNDSITGTTGNVLTATFSVAGSKIGFTGGQTFLTTNSINFTGTGNILSISPALINASGSIASAFTAGAISTLEVNGQWSGALLLTNFGTSINTVYLDGTSTAPAPTLGAAAISTLPAGATVGLGMSSTAITSLGGALTLNGTAGAVTINILGISPASAVADSLIINTFSTATINLSTVAIPTVANSLSFAISSTSVTTLTVTGGNDSSSAVSFVLPSTTTTFNASASLSPVSVTGGSGNNTITGSTGADTIDAKGITNSITGHGGLGATATDINLYKFTSPGGITTVTDFNAATSSSSVDKIQFLHDMNGPSGFTTFISGNGSMVTAGTTINISSWSAGTTITLAPANNLIKYTVANVANAAALGAILGSNVNLASGVAAVATSGFPIVYSDGSNVRVAVFQWGDTSNIISASPVVSDIAILTGVSITNMDATDFGVFI
jgi:hypothetical protein